MLEKQLLTPIPLIVNLIGHHPIQAHAGVALADFPGHFQYLTGRLLASLSTLVALGELTPASLIPLHFLPAGFFSPAESPDRSVQNFFYIYLQFFLCQLHLVTPQGLFLLLDSLAKLVHLALMALFLYH